MKRIILLLALIMFASCREEEMVIIPKTEFDKLVGNKPSEYPKPLPDFKTGQWEVSQVSIVVVDSCEIITGFSFSDGGPVAFHRPRCKFCKERAKKETYQQLIEKQ